MLISPLCFLDISTHHSSFYIFKISFFLKIFMVIWRRIDPLLWHAGFVYIVWFLDNIVSFYNNIVIYNL